MPSTQPAEGSEPKPHDPSSTILVTGASGMVGGEVARQLKSAGVSFAAMTREPSRVKSALGGEVQVRYGDYRNPGSLDAAFAGVGCLFLVAPLVPELAELEIAAIDAARRAGVHHVVKLSTAGVTQKGGETVPRQYPLHRRSEEHLERSGLGLTLLRAAPFMQNTLNFAPSIRAEGVFRGAWGEGEMAYVDVRDLAEVAVRVLTEPGHERRAYELTGPEALSPADLARILSETTGREIRYVDVPPEAVRQAMIQRGASEWFAGLMAEVMEHARIGAAGRVTDTVQAIIGRPPTSFAKFARAFASRFIA